MHVSMSAGVRTNGSAQMGGAVPAGWGADDGDLGKGLFCNLDLSLLPQWAWVCVNVWGSDDDPRNRT